MRVGHQITLLLVLLVAVLTVAWWLAGSASPDAQPPIATPDTSPAKASNRPDTRPNNDTPEIDTTAPDDSEAQDAAEVEDPDDTYVDDRPGERRQAHVEYFDLDSGEIVANSTFVTYLWYLRLEESAWSIGWAYRSAFERHPGSTDDAGRAPVRILVQTEYDQIELAVPIPLGWFGWFCIEEAALNLKAQSEAETPEPVRLPLRRAADLEIQVVDAQGRPVPNHWVMVVWTLRDSAAPFTASRRWVHEDEEYTEWMWQENLELMNDHGCSIGQIGIHDRFWPADEDDEDDGWERRQFIRFSDYDSRNLFDADDSHSFETNAEGRMLVPDLMPCRHSIALLDTRHNFVIQEISLVPGLNTYRVQLETLLWNTLEVEVLWQGPEEERPERVEVGLTPIIDGAMLGLMYVEYEDVVVGPAPGPLASLTVSRVADGTWLVRADAVSLGDQGPSNLGASQSVEVTGGITQRVTLVLTPNSWASFAGEVRFDGAELEDLEMTFRTVHGHSYRTFSGGEGVELPSGDYLLVIPGVGTRPIRLGPGESRREVIDVPSGSATFSIADDLFALMSQASSSVDLRLGAADNELDKVVSAILRQAPDSPDPADQTFRLLANGAGLMPDLTVSGRLPAGEYRWSLAGDHTLSGSFTVAAGQDLRVHFGWDNLPGSGVLEVEFTGFGADDVPDVSAATASELQNWRVRQKFEETGSASVVRIAADRVLVIARPGTVQLEFKQFGRHNPGGTRFATVPGRLRITAADLEVPTGEVVIMSGSGRNIPFRFELRHPTFGSWPVWAGEYQLPRGEWSLMAVHDRSVGGKHYAFERIVVGEHPVTVDVDDLTWHGPEAVHLKISLPGNAALHTHPDDLIEAYVIEFLDSRLGEMPLRAMITDVRVLALTTSPFEISFWPVYLLPGNYRLVSRSDKSGSSAVHFTVRPDQDTQVHIKHR